MKWMNECNKTAEWTVKDVEIPAMKRRTIGMRKVDVVDRLALAHTLPISFYLLRIHSLQFTELCSRRGKSTHSNRPSTSMGCLGAARWTDGGKYVVRNQCDSVFFFFFFHLMVGMQNDRAPKCVTIQRWYYIFLLFLAPRFFLIWNEISQGKTRRCCSRCRRRCS